MLLAVQSVDWHQPAPWVILGLTCASLVAASVVGVRKWAASKGLQFSFQKRWPFMTVIQTDPTAPDVSPEIKQAASLSTAYEACLTDLNTKRNIRTQAELSVLTAKQQYDAAVTTQEQAVADHEAAKAAAHAAFTALQEASTPLFT